MEEAGFMDQIPCLAIRRIYDSPDSHEKYKNKNVKDMQRWHAKELLSITSVGSIKTKVHDDTITNP